MAATCSARRRRGRSSTIRLPAISGRAASSSAAWKAAPAEIPTSRPSRSAACARGRKRGLVVDRDRPRRSPSGRGPRGRSRRRSPGSCAGPAARPRAPREVAGSTATTWTPGRRSFSTWPTPVIVPPVPTPQTSASTSPSRSRPDLLGRGPAVDLGVGGVRELLRHERAALGDDLLGEPDRLAHPAQRRRLVDLGAVGAQQLGPLAAHPLGQRQHELVAARGADHRQRDPGVAAGRLDDRAARARACRRARRRRSSRRRSGP